MDQVFWEGQELSYLAIVEKTHLLNLMLPLVLPSWVLHTSQLLAEETQMKHFIKKMS